MKPKELQEKQPKANLGKQKISMEYIEDKVKRNTTFYKRKAGIFKQCNDLVRITGGHALALAISETGHVHAYASSIFRPIITDKDKKSMIVECIRDELSEPLQKLQYTQFHINNESDDEISEPKNENKSAPLNMNDLHTQHINNNEWEGLFEVNNDLANFMDNLGSASASDQNLNEIGNFPCLDANGNKALFGNKGWYGPVDRNVRVGFEKIPYQANVVSDLPNLYFGQF